MDETRYSKLNSVTIDSYTCELLQKLSNQTMETFDTIVSCSDYVDSGLYTAERSRLGELVKAIVLASVQRVTNTESES